MTTCSEFHQSLLQSLTAKHGGNQLQHTWQWDYQSASLKILFKTTAKQLSTNTASSYFRLHLRLALGQATQQLFFRTACLDNYFWVYCRPQVFCFTLLDQIPYLSSYCPQLLWNAPLPLEASWCDCEQNTMTPILDQLLQSRPGGLSPLSPTLPYFFSTSGQLSWGSRNKHTLYILFLHPPRYIVMNTENTCSRIICYLMQSH